MNNQELKDKTIVITGASSGVGKAMAIELAKHGAKLVLAARRQQALEDVANECNNLGGVALAVPADIRSIENIQTLAAKAADFGGNIDVWINNAGVLAAGALEDVPAEVNENVIRTNLLGYIFSAHVVLPYFKQQRHGILINNISVGGWFPVPYGTAYAASKFGLRGYSEALQGELREYLDIHVCDLYPGFLDTPGMQHAANYTGKALKPAPPLYNPQKVARAVVSVIRSPQTKVTIGASSIFLKTAYNLFPALSRAITAAVIRTYLKRANPLPQTSGNILQPVDYGTSIEGGWRKPFIRSSAGKLMLAGLAAGLAGLTMGFVMGSRK